MWKRLIKLDLGFVNCIAPKLSVVSKDEQQSVDRVGLEYSNAADL
jgi:hypothetical protein